MSKYSKQRELAEYYRDFPYGKELNKAIWDFFEGEDRHLWLSDIEEIANTLKVPLTWAIMYVLTIERSKPQYPKPLYLWAYYKTNNQVVNLTDQVGKNLSNEDLCQEALRTFPYWHPEPSKLVIEANSEFLNPNNSLLNLWIKKFSNDDLTQS